MIIERIRLILHHRGSLLREEGVLKYVGGEMCVWEGIDIDTVNIITVEALCKEHYYPRFDKIYWLKPGRKLEVRLRVLEKDAHVSPTLSKSSTPHVASPLHTSEMSDGSDDYESAEDSAYRPSPCLSDEDDSVVKKKSDKGKGIAVDSSKKMKSPAGRKRKGRDCATGSGNAGTANREHEQETEEPAHMDEDNIFEYEEPGHRDQYDSFEHEVNEHGGVPPKPKNWAPPTTENEQSQQDEVDLSQGVPNSDPQESQPTNIVDDTSAGNEGNNFTASTYTPAVAEVQLNVAPNVVGRNTTTAPTPIQIFAAPNITGGSTGVRPPSKGMPSKNPPYRPPGLVTKAVFRHKMKTLRPPSSRSVVSPQSTPTEPLAPSQGVIQPSSQTSGEQPMTFIPTPRGPPPQPK
ncbi:hypothetical protein SESBI_32491 [Sesbania bispinosa]|nr:hypothetical protein SESBI_32491 [Sesbania bispinosa]